MALKLRFAERRVLSVLIEKGYTTPDQYPMTLNSLISGCNQKSCRDPVSALLDSALGAAVIYINFGDRGLALVAQRIYDLSITFAIIAVPLFIFMATLLERSGIAKDMYNSLNIVLGESVDP